jgi:phosphoribosyl-ATP pyrophosphohydrolase
MSDSLDRLYAAVLTARVADPTTSRTARLLRAGRSKMAKKLAEEAIEVAIDAVHGHSDLVVRESADRLLGIAEKLPKDRPDASPRRKVVALDRSRARKRR